MCVSWNTEYFGLHNTIIWNRVYRPTSQNFLLAYTESLAQYSENAINNPFWHQQSGGYTYAVGADIGSDQSGWCTTTFQYGT